MLLQLVTPPASEPLTTDEAKAQLRLEHNEDDTLVAALVVEARECAEAFTNRALLTQTWKLLLPGFCAKIDLPKPPLQSVASVKYLDASGVEQTLDPSRYEVISDANQAFIIPAYGASWPTVREQMGAVRVTFVAGYGTAADVPQTFKQAMAIYLAQRYEDREGRINIPPAAENLLWRFRVVPC